jgi:anti-sigma B factor antagonist
MQLRNVLKSRSASTTPRGSINEALDRRGYGALTPGVKMSDKPANAEPLYRVYRTDDVVRVEFLELHVVGHESVTQLQERLAQVIKRVPQAKMVLDMKAVQYISSSALGELLSAHKQLQARQGCMSMAHVGPELREIIETTRLDAVFSIHENVADAIKSFGDGSAPQ